MQRWFEDEEKKLTEFYNNLNLEIGEGIMSHSVAETGKPFINSGTTVLHLKDDVTSKVYDLNPGEMLVDGQVYKTVNTPDYVEIDKIVAEANKQLPAEGKPHHEFETGAKRESVGVEYFDGPLYALRRVAAISFEGAKKYGRNNWRKGLPKHEIFNHALDHLLRWREGDRSEDNLGKAAWGLLALIVEEEVELKHIDRMPSDYFPLKG